MDFSRAYCGESMDFNSVWYSFTPPILAINGGHRHFSAIAEQTESDGISSTFIIILSVAVSALGNVTCSATLSQLIAICILA